MISFLQDDLALTSGISPRTSTLPARDFWGINQSVRYGSTTTILANTAGIVDTGKRFPSRFLLSD